MNSKLAMNIILSDHTGRGMQSTLKAFLRADWRPISRLSKIGANRVLISIFPGGIHRLFVCLASTFFPCAC